MDPDKLPDNLMEDADPERKMFSASEVEGNNLQTTPQSEEGDLSLLRSKGISRIDLRDRK